MSIYASICIYVCVCIELFAIGVERRHPAAFSCFKFTDFHAVNCSAFLVLILSAQNAQVCRTHKHSLSFSRPLCVSLSLSKVSPQSLGTFLYMCFGFFVSMRPKRIMQHAICVYFRVHFAAVAAASGTRGRLPGWLAGSTVRCSGSFLEINQCPSVHSRQFVVVSLSNYFQVERRLALPFAFALTPQVPFPWRISIRCRQSNH